MVVLSASVCTKSGKALVSRQFVSMSRIRIEGLLAAFPKLVGGGGANTQHTFIETDTVRYVYQPIEDLFLLLITNKASNIVEDLETLRLLSKVVPDICGGITEDKVSNKMFELIFAFDEVLSTGGHRENITMAQIQVNLSMESHEEKLHKMIEQSKITSTKENADQVAKNLREQRQANKMPGMGGGGSMAGIEGGSGGDDMYGDKHISSAGSYQPSTTPSSSFNTSSPSTYTPAPSRSEPVLPKKGMQLGGGAKKQSMMDKLVSEDNLMPTPAPQSAATQSSLPAPPPPEASHPINILLEEKISASLNREGVVESLEVKGTMFLTVAQDDAAKCKIILAPSKNPIFAFQTNPKVDKKAFEATNMLALKDASKGFPKNKAVGVLRWSATTQDESQVPISINCWPEEDGPNMNVSVEYTVEKAGVELHNVAIVIPLGTSAAPSIDTCETGAPRHNRSQDELIWEIDLIDSSNKNASLEFSIAQQDADAFFPIKVHFASPQLSAGIDVADVVNVDSGASISHGTDKRAITESYTVM